jgi:small multidrug resistance pump
MLLPISKNFTKPLISIVLVIAYMLSFYLLTFALKEIPIAIAYSTWAGIGILLFTLFGYLFQGQSIQWQYLKGLQLIGRGVAIVNRFKDQKLV